MKPYACALKQAVLSAALAAAFVVLPDLALSSTLVVTSQNTKNVLGYDGTTADTESVIRPLMRPPGFSGAAVA